MLFTKYDLQISQLNACIRWNEEMLKAPNVKERDAERYYTNIQQLRDDKWDIIHITAQL